MEHGAWSMEHGAWSMEHGAWYLGCPDLAAPDAKPFHAQQSALACIEQTDDRDLIYSQQSFHGARFG
jgi:hypothetical protein